MNNDDITVLDELADAIDHLADDTAAALRRATHGDPT